MGYTTVDDRSAAVRAAALLAAAADWEGAAGRLGHLRLLIDQVMAESGVVEPHVAGRALDQAAGDVARACCLVRAWAAVLPRLPSVRVGWDGLRTTRRITPGFAEPRGGQYLGASVDYAQRILDLSAGPAGRPARNGQPAAVPEPAPDQFPRAAEALQAEGLVAPPLPVAEPVDLTRVAASRTGRGALLQVLARAETGALTALAYTYIRGFAARQDPTLLELRAGTVPVRIPRPGGGPVTVGEVALTTAEVAVYRLHGGRPEPRLTIGVGATVGGLERRAVAAAVLDAACSRAAADPAQRREPCEDAEFLAVALDGQEASGFVEHLKLPHHVTFTSELDRLRQARRGDGEEGR